MAGTSGTDVRKLPFASSRYGEATRTPLPVPERETGRRQYVKEAVTPEAVLISSDGSFPLPKTMQFTNCGVPAPLLMAAPPPVAVFPPMLQW